MGIRGKDAARLALGDSPLAGHPPPLSLAKETALLRTETWPVGGGQNLSLGKMEREGEGRWRQQRRRARQGEERRGEGKGPVSLDHIAWVPFQAPSSFECVYFSKTEDHIPLLGD